jgi:hypothetical protein
MIISSPKFLLAIACSALLCFGEVMADGLDITKFKEVYSNGSKEKDANLVYVTNDGAIVIKGSPGSNPAIKLDLTNEPEHLVMQDVPTKKETKDLDVSVEVWASSDLQHGKGDGMWSDAGPGIYYIQASVGHPNVDFWFLRGIGHGYCLANLEKGKWNRVAAQFSSPYGFNSDHFEFHVPIGSGFILLRNPGASPAN